MHSRCLLLSVLLSSLLAGCTWSSARRPSPGDAPAQTVAVETPVPSAWPSPVSSQPSPAPLVQTVVVDTSTPTPWPSPAPSVQTVAVETPTTMPWPSPTPFPTPLPEGAVGAAVAYLAAELGVPETEVSVIAVEAVEWSDSSLGCPEPGMAYLTVITPGYRIILEVAGLRYEVHTDETGRFVAACE